MRKSIVFLVVLAFVLGSVGYAMAAGNMMQTKEKEIHAEFVKMIPKDHLIDVYKLHEVWEKAMKDPAFRAKIYMIDVRTDTEFNLFHIEGTDHIQAGHMYVIPKKISDPNTPIYVWCRTNHRAKYVGGFLYKYGYKNVYVVSSKGDNKGGVVGWAQAGFPFVNQLAGTFKILEYRPSPSKEESPSFYHVRMWHPY
jgi:rhodanese-related sulfurtransferase